MLDFNPRIQSGCFDPIFVK